MTLGDILRADGQLERAVACYRRMTALDPGDAAAHAALADALKSLNRIDEALESYDAALRLAPDDVGTLFNQGNTLSAAGRLDDALSAYRRLADSGAGKRAATAFYQLPLAERRSVVTV